MSIILDVPLEGLDCHDEPPGLLPHQARLVRTLATLLALKRSAPLFLCTPPGTGKTEVARQALLWTCRRSPKDKVAYVTPGQLVESTLAKLAARAAGEALPLRPAKRARLDGVVCGEPPLLLAPAASGRDVFKSASMRRGGLAWLLASRANVHVISKDVVPDAAFFEHYALVVVDDAHLCPGLVERLASRESLRGRVLAMSSIVRLRSPSKWLTLRLRPSADVETVCGFARLELSIARVVCADEAQMLSYWKDVMSLALKRSQRSERALCLLEAVWCLGSCSMAIAAALASTIREVWRRLPPDPHYIPAASALRFASELDEDRDAARRAAVAAGDPWAVWARSCASGAPLHDLRLPDDTLALLERAHRRAAHRPVQDKLERLALCISESGRSGFSCLLARTSEDAVRSTAEALRRDARCCAASVAAIEACQGRRRHAAVVEAVSWGGCRAALAVLRRLAGSASHAPLACVLRLGHGHVLGQILGYVGGMRVLVAGGSLDAGYDLHHHVDGVCLAELPATHQDVRQQLGRVRRVCRGRPAPPVKVQCVVAAGTVEEALAHVFRQGMNGEE